MNAIEASQGLRSESGSRGCGTSLLYFEATETSLPFKCLTGNFHPGPLPGRRPQRLESPENAEDTLQATHDLTNQIREDINGIFRQVLLPSDINHEQVFCSLDIIEDTDLAIEAYRTQNFPDDTGQKYLWIHGVLQCLVIQQDAVMHLGACFGLQLNPNRDDGARSVRALRNSVTGHPTRQSQNVENGPCYNGISRITLSRDRFRRLRANRLEVKFDDVNLPEFFQVQEVYIQKSLGSIIEAAAKAVTEHAKNYAAEPLSDMLKWTVELAQSLSRGETQDLWGRVELVKSATKKRLLSTHLSDYHEPLIWNALSRLLQQNNATHIEDVRRSVERFTLEILEFDEEFQRQAEG